LFGLRRERGRVERSKVELATNRLILLYSTSSLFLDPNELIRTEENYLKKTSRHHS